MVLLVRRVLKFNKIKKHEMVHSKSSQTGNTVRSRTLATSVSRVASQSRFREAAFRNSAVIEHLKRVLLSLPEKL